MWNNYTVHMLNRDKIARRQAEAEAQRLGDQGHVPGVHTHWVAVRLERVVAHGASWVARLRQAAGTEIRAARSRAAAAATRVRHVHRPHRPHLAIGHHRA